MVVRSAYPLKTFKTLAEAEAYAKKIDGGAGKHADSELEIHWNPKVKATGSLGGKKGMSLKQVVGQADDIEEAAKPWAVMVLNETVPPGAKPCAECEQPFFGDDYICPECRERS